MTVDVATRPAAERARPTGVRWRWVLLLAAAVLAALVLYAVGVLLPDFVKGLHHLPPSDVGDGVHDPGDLWPRNAWGAAVRLVGSVSAEAAAAAAALLASAWLVRRRRASRAGELPRPGGAAPELEGTRPVR